MFNLAVFFQVVITSIISVYIFPIAEFLNEKYDIPENPTKIILFSLAVLTLYIIQVYLNHNSEYGKYSKFVEDTNKNYEKFEGYHSKIETYINKHMMGIEKIENLVKLNQKKTLGSISRHIEEMQDELIGRIQSIDTKYSGKINKSMQTEFRDDLNKLMKYSNLKLHTLTSEVYDSSDELEYKNEVM